LITEKMYEDLKKVFDASVSEYSSLRIKAPWGVRSRIMRAIENNDAEKVKEYHGRYSLNNFFDFACEDCQNTEILQMLIDDGAEVNKQDSHGATPLLTMVKNQRFAAGLATLIKNGADPNLSDNRGYTPLMALLYDEFIDSRADEYKVLAEASDVTVANKRGLTALFYAEHNHHLHNSEILTDIRKRYEAQTKAQSGKR